jgi:excisionase family DNA binding protein
MLPKTPALGSAERNDGGSFSRSRDDGIERHYATSELAELLSVNPETIRREAARGHLKSIRIGTQRRYPESAVRDYLASRADVKDVTR